MLNKNLIAIFIDASNVWGSHKEIGVMIDFNKTEMSYYVEKKEMKKQPI